MKALLGTAGAGVPQAVFEGVNLKIAAGTSYVLLNLRKVAARAIGSLVQRTPKHTVINCCNNKILQKTPLQDFMLG